MKQCIFFLLVALLAVPSFADKSDELLEEIGKLCAEMVERKEMANKIVGSRHDNLMRMYEDARLQKERKIKELVKISPGHAFESKLSEKDLKEEIEETLKSANSRRKKAENCVSRSEDDAAMELRTMANLRRTEVARMEVALWKKRNPGSQKHNKQEEGEYYIVNGKHVFAPASQLPKKEEYEMMLINGTWMEVPKHRS